VPKVKTPGWATMVAGGGALQAVDGGTVVEVDHPTRGKYLTVGNPIKMSDSISEVKRSPLLGEHTDEILSKVLGFDKKAVAEIKNSGALSAPEKKEKAA